MTLGASQDEVLCDLLLTTNVHYASDGTWNCSGGKPSTPVCQQDNTTWLGVSCEDGCVTAIVLDGSHINPSFVHTRRLWYETAVLISGQLPASIGNLVTLKQLSLPWNVIKGSIPPAIGKLSALQILNLAYNSITGGIPSTVGKLSSLQTLTLSHNSLTGSIPASLGLLSTLGSLSLAGNALSGSVPSSLCKSLTSLALYSAMNATVGNGGLQCYASCLGGLVNQSYGNLRPCGSNQSASPSRAPTIVPIMIPTLLPTVSPSVKPTERYGSACVR